MGDVVLEGQVAKACPRNHGAWLDHAQLDALAEDRSDDATPAQEDTAWSASSAHPEDMVTERFRTCPVCAKTLQKDNWKYGSGVVVDTCREHGVWVDAGEIERLEAWAEAWERHTAVSSAD